LVAIYTRASINGSLMHAREPRLLMTHPGVGAVTALGICATRAF
jgi:hypothetical protein